VVTTVELHEAQEVSDALSFLCYCEYIIFRLQDGTDKSSNWTQIAFETRGAVCIGLARPLSNNIVVSLIDIERRCKMRSSERMSMTDSLALHISCSPIHNCPKLSSAVSTYSTDRRSDGDDDNSIGLSHYRGLIVRSCLHEMLHVISIVHLAL